MPSIVATLIFIIGIAGLFWLDRDEKVRTSATLWLPVIWVGLACSRSVSQWENASRQNTTGGSADAVLEGNLTDRLIFTGLMIIGIIILFTGGRKVGQLLRANGTILFFFFYCAVSIIWSDFPDISFKRWFKALGDLVMILIVLTDPDPLEAVKRFMKRISFILIPLSILFIKYYVLIGTSYSPWGGRAEPRGVALNKNSLGVLCLIFGINSMWRVLTIYKDREAADRRRRLIAHGVILAMVAWLLSIANSMTSLNCFLMATLLLLAMTIRAINRRPAVVHTLIATMVTVTVSVLFFGASPDALAAMGKNPTLTDRTEVWGWLFSLVRNPMVGTGFESFWLGPRLERLWSIYWWHPNEAHNGYIEIYLNLGWIGIALLGITLVIGYRKIVAAYRHNMPLANLALAYFLVGVTYNCTEAALFKMMAPAWIFLLFAMVSVPAVSYYKVHPAAQNMFQVPGAYGDQSGAQMSLK
jgi:exopolysaccharide production protein ExoQ